MTITDVRHKFTSLEKLKIELFENRSGHVSTLKLLKITFLNASFRETTHNKTVDFLFYYCFIKKILLRRNIHFNLAGTILILEK